MLRLLAGLGLVATTLMLSGCYLGPDYGYVRQTGYQGGAYYGQSRAYDGGYYLGSGYAPYYYGSGYGYGCCYAPGVSVGVGAVWYDRPRYRRYAPPPPRYRRYVPSQDRRQFDNRPRAGGGWRSGSSRPGRGEAGPGRRGSDRGSMSPRRNGGHHTDAGRHRSRNP
ncbi:MAG TPA: hypothetical protein VN614_04655 [Rhodanobacter sp.]|jgi:hypothetical protein|nr:hypothetical protein [Rhodanobacter sp.]